MGIQWESGKGREEEQKVTTTNDDNNRYRWLILRTPRGPPTKPPRWCRDRGVRKMGSTKRNRKNILIRLNAIEGETRDHVALFTRIKVCRKISFSWGSFWTLPSRVPLLLKVLMCSPMVKWLVGHCHLHSNERLKRITGHSIGPSVQPLTVFRHSMVR